MCAKLLAMPDPPEIRRTKTGRVMDSESAKALRRLSPNARTRGQKSDNYFKRLEALMREFAHEFFSVPIEGKDGKAESIIEKTRRKLAEAVDAMDPKARPDQVVAVASLIAKYTLPMPKAEESKKVVGNPDVERDLGVEEEAKLARGPANP